MKKYAYVTLVMIGDFYVAGAIALAHSIRKTWIDKKNNNINLVCMVTNDVTKRDWLEEYFDEVIDVDYIYQQTQLLTQNQNKIYGDWISASFTKLNCLKLCPYEKIIFLDSDLLFVTNIDHLFQMEAPAGAFNHTKDFDLKQVRNKIFGYNEIVSDKIIYRNLTTKWFVVNASIFIIKPSMYDFIRMLFILYKKDIYSKPCLSSSEECLLSELYLGVKPWRNITLDYLYIDRHMPSDFKNKFPPKILDFRGEKPWVTENSEWSDIKLWWDKNKDIRKELIERRQPKISFKLTDNFIEINDKKYPIRYSYYSMVQNNPIYH